VFVTRDEKFSYISSCTLQEKEEETKEKESKKNNQISPRIKFNHYRDLNHIAIGE